jgi:hypothetical protein
MLHWKSMTSYAFTEHFSCVDGTFIHTYIWYEHNGMDAETFFWDVTRRNFVADYQGCDTAYRFHLQGLSSPKGV